MSNQMDVCKCGIAKIDYEYNKDNRVAKDYSRIEKYEYGKCYFNENDVFHRLTGSAVEWLGGNKSYCINGIFYMKLCVDSNKLYIYPVILELVLEYEKYIQQNIKDFVREYNAEIKLYYFKEEQVNQLPDWLKDLISV